MNLPVRLGEGAGKTAPIRFGARGWYLLFFLLLLHHFAALLTLHHAAKVHLENRFSIEAHWFESSPIRFS
jgi:hypothetical protein